MQSGSVDNKEAINAAAGCSIHEARLDKGLKQKTLAEIVNMDPKYLSRIENGHSGVSRELLIRTGQELGSGFDYIYILMIRNWKRKMLWIQKSQESWGNAIRLRN